MSAPAGAAAAQPPVELAIIGGTGVYDPAILSEAQQQVIETPYGEALVTVGSYAGRRLAFMARHGTSHGVPPHLINYRANIWALAYLGVTTVLATNAVGSLEKRFAPGQLVLCDQFLDFTHSRAATFFDGGADGVAHVDVTEPYCPDVRAALTAAAQQLELPLHNGGTYVCTQGPRFETPAEINMFANLGAQVVGMTSVPEVVLAQEAGLCYATICLVSNYAAGLAGQPLSHDEVVAILDQYESRLRTLITEVLPLLAKDRRCNCRQGPAPLPGLATVRADLENL